MAMSRHTRIVVLVFIVALLAGVAARAQPVDTYDLSWWTVDGGGIVLSSGGGYALAGTAGQPDAGTLAGGGYELAGGFWGGGAIAPDYELYLPLVTNRH
jgi:hypothetical protein